MEKSADAFRTISEVADELRVPQHVLRFWETKFPQIRPLKRAGGRRYYRPADTVLLRAIRQLLYDEGYTIKGVQRLLKEQGVRRLGAGAGPPAVENADAEPEWDAASIDPGPPPRIEPSFATDIGSHEDAAGSATDPPDVRPASHPAMEAPLGRAGDALRDALALVEECLGIIRAAR